MRLSSSFLTLAVFTGVAAAAEINHLSIQSYTRWGVDRSPYVIRGQVAVEAGSTLSIDPGVKVVCAYSTSTPCLVIKGSLRAIGKPSSRVTFSNVTMGVFETSAYGTRLEECNLNGYTRIESDGQGSVKLVRSSADSLKLLSTNVDTVDSSLKRFESKFGKLSFSNSDVNLGQITNPAMLTIDRSKLNGVFLLAEVTEQFILYQTTLWKSDLKIGQGTRFNMQQSIFHTSQLYLGHTCEDDDSVERVIADVQFVSQGSYESEPRAVTARVPVTMSRVLFYGLQTAIKSYCGEVVLEDSALIDVDAPHYLNEGSRDIVVARTYESTGDSGDSDAVRRIAPVAEWNDEAPLPPPSNVRAERMGGALREVVRLSWGSSSQEGNQIDATYQVYFLRFNELQRLTLSANEIDIETNSNYFAVQAVAQDGRRSAFTVVVSDEARDDIAAERFYFLLPNAAMPVEASSASSSTYATDTEETRVTIRLRSHASYFVVLNLLALVCMLAWIYSIEMRLREQEQSRRSSISLVAPGVDRRRALTETTRPNTFEGVSTSPRYQPAYQPVPVAVSVEPLLPEI
mmetsp:Transcript_3580/g.7222  ORF Transcript_3580/g.7222 Transcript_3580/m.7222 type:complete len:571 (+) Transcript_3580:56-1768(+)